MTESPYDRRINLWNKHRVAEYLGIHPVTVGLWARQGKIPAKKIGTVWRFVPELIEAWVRNGEPKKD